MFENTEQLVQPYVKQMQIVCKCARIFSGLILTSGPSEYQAHAET